MPTDGPSGPGRRAAVLGSPIAHSRSPLIHGAGYAAAGLSGWSYVAIECVESGLPGLVAGLGPEWAGLSLTMPLKETALTVADLVDPFALAIGAANTLVRRGEGWHAYNTDAPGIVRALAESGAPTVDRVAVLGGGGTARAALAAAARMGATGTGAAVTVYARRPEAVDELRPVAEALGVALTGADWEQAYRCAEAPVVISTVPKGVADPLADIGWKPGTTVLDAVYDPWPTPLAAGAARAGCVIVSGLDLLLWQAVDQFELFTGVAAPIEEMKAAARLPVRA